MEVAGYTIYYDWEKSTQQTVELQKRKQMIAIKSDTCGCWDGECALPIN